MSTFDCHSAFLANLPSEPSPANPKKRIHALPHSNSSPAMTTADPSSSSYPPSPSSTTTRHHPKNVLHTPVKASQSFADFFSASTPVPASVTLLLSYTRPAIHGFHTLLQLLTWTSDRSVKSFLVLFAWWALCLGTETFWVFGGVQVGLVLWSAYLWIQSRKATTLHLQKLATEHQQQSGSNAPLSPVPVPGTPQSGRFSFSSGTSSRSGLLANTSARHPTTTQLDQAATLREIQEILDHWAAWNRTLDRWETWLDWSDPSRTRLVLGLAVFSLGPWLVAHYFIPTRFIFAFLGSVAICWRAPWFGILWAVGHKLMEVVWPLLQMVPYFPFKSESFTASYHQKKKTRFFSVKDIIARAIGQRKKDDSEGNGNGVYQSYKTKTGYDIEEDHATMYYKFVLYENQRWWLGLEWTPMMLPNDRAPWTDDHLEPTQSKSAFQLPPPHIAHEPIPGQPNKVLRKSQEWRWLDPHWRLQLLGTGSSLSGRTPDVDGWEYANNHWQKWSGKNRRGAYTRRRAWERTAKLMDQREIVMMEDILHELPAGLHQGAGHQEVEEEEEEEEEESGSEEEEEEEEEE